MARREGPLLLVQPPPEVPGFGADRARHLLELEHDHFWFPPRRELLGRRLERLLASPVELAVELGCGAGGLLPLLARHARTVVGVEGHELLARRAAARGAGAVVVGDVFRVPLAGGCAGLIVAADVLEHVAPGPFLAEARRLAAPGARLLVTVPASPLLWSGADEAAGHRCRYTRRRLEEELAAAGWRPLGATHYQMALAPLLLLRRALGWRRAEPLERRPPPLAARLLGAVNRAEVRLLGGVSLPWGSSLVAWAEAA